MHFFPCFIRLHTRLKQKSSIVCASYSLLQRFLFGGEKNGLHRAQPLSISTVEKDLFHFRPYRVLYNIVTCPRYAGLIRRISR